MNDEWVSWAAGFFDGEGSVRINKATKQNQGHLTVEISNLDRALLDEFAARYGGTVRKASGLRVDQRQAYVWKAAAGQALTFLHAIRPYVRSERNQMRIALAEEFQSGARHGWHGSSVEYKGWRFGCYLRMKALNRRGITAPTLDELREQESMLLACPDASEHRK
jgi:hypothetical protein